MKTDFYILSDLTNGSSKAFEVVFNDFHARVYHFIHSCVFDKAAAQDLTQTVFLTIWEHRESIDPTRNITSYIFTIARNCVYRYTERAILSVQYKQQLLLTSDDLLYDDQEQKIDTQMLEDYIWSLIEKLPASRREIFILSRKNGLSNKEIARHLSISEKTVETQITRSIQFIKKHIKSHVALMGLMFFHLS